MNPGSPTPTHIPSSDVPPSGLEDTTATRLRLAIAAGGLGVWEWDRRNDVILWDDGMSRLFGLEPGQAPTSIEDYMGLLYPEDVAQTSAIVTGALEDHRHYTVNHRVRWPDGQVRWIEGRGQPVVTDGEVVGIVGVSRDVTEEREAEAERERLLAEEAAARAAADAERDRLEFLIEAKATLSEHVDLQGQLDELSRLAIPRFADGSVVHLVDDNGTPRMISLHHRDRDQIPLVEELFERYPITLDDRLGVGAALRTGRSGWMARVTDEMITAAAETDEHRELLRRLDVTSGLVVPLLDPDGEAFGSITFVTTRGRRMRQSDLVLVEQLCLRVSTLLRNAALLEARELDRRAHRYQAALLSSVLEASVDGVLAVGPDGEVLTHNRKFLQLWEFDEDLVDRGDEALLDAARQRVPDPDAFVAGVRSAYEERPAKLRDEIELISGRILDRHGTCLTGPEGEFLGFMWSFRDVTLERTQATAVAEAGKRSAMLARTLQQSLLPPRLPRIPGVDLAARYHPAYEGVDIGGDFYDVFAVGDDWILVVGDVCGKGAEAASLTALARYTIRAATNHSSDPAAILAELNSVMVADADASSGMTRFATVCCIRLRPGAAAEGTVVADVACGGHPPPLVVRANRSTEEVGVPGTLLGVFPEVRITTASTTLGAGDAIIGVTDGVLEARDARGELFEVEGMKRVLGPLGGRPAGRMCAELQAAALDQQDGVARDDIAILVARVENRPR